MVLDAPRITIRDPARPGPAGDAADTAEPPGRAGWTVAALVAALALVIGASAVGEQARGRDAAEQRRLDAVVEISLSSALPAGPPLSEPLPGRERRTGLDLEIRNDGPRQVRVERAELGELRWLGELALAPGETGQLPLERTATCPRGGGLPALDAAPTGLALAVATRTAVTDVVLASDQELLERVTSSTRRACGFLPVQDAVEVVAGPTLLRATGFTALLQVVNSAVRPLRLTSVQALPGLQVGLVSVRGEPVRLPAYVAPSRLDGPPSVTVFALRVRIDCDRVGPQDAARASRLDVEVDDGVAGAAATRQARFASSTTMRQLVERSCAEPGPVTPSGTSASS